MILLKFLKKKHEESVRFTIVPAGPTISFYASAKHRESVHCLNKIQYNAAIYSYLNVNLIFRVVLSCHCG